MVDGDRPEQRRLQLSPLCVSPKLCFHFHARCFLLSLGASSGTCHLPKSMLPNFYSSVIHLGRKGHWDALLSRGRWVAWWLELAPIPGLSQDLWGSLVRYREGWLEGGGSKELVVADTRACSGLLHHCPGGAPPSSLCCLGHVAPRVPHCLMQPAYVAGRTWTREGKPSTRPGHRI